MSDEPIEKKRRREGSDTPEGEDDVRFLKRELKKLARVQLHLRQKFEVLHEASNRLYESLSQVAPVDYPDELKSVIAIEGSRTDVRFLSFAGLNLGMGIPPFEFLRSLSNRDVPGWFIKDFHQSWYQKGLLGITSSATETTGYLRGLIGENDGRRLVTLGASSGGYAAMIYGCWLGAERVVAFSPQTLINRRIASQYAAIDTPESLRFLDKSAGILNLRIFLQQQERLPEITVYYGSDHEQDTQEAMHLDGLDGVTLVPVAGVEGHSVTGELRKRGDLEQILDRLVTF
jgi:hypothetical protein